VRREKKMKLKTIPENEELLDCITPNCYIKVKPKNQFT